MKIEQLEAFNIQNIQDTRVADLRCEIKSQVKEYPFWKPSLNDVYSFSNRYRVIEKRVLEIINEEN